MECLRPVRDDYFERLAQPEQMNQNSELPSDRDVERQSKEPKPWQFKDCCTMAQWQALEKRKQRTRRGGPVFKYYL